MSGNQEKKTSRRYYKRFEEMCADPRISKTCWRVLTALILHTDGSKGNTCVPSRDQLSSFTGIHVDNISKALTQLQHLGWTTASRKSRTSKPSFVVNWTRENPNEKDGESSKNYRQNQPVTTGKSDHELLVEPASKKDELYRQNQPVRLFDDKILPIMLA